MRSKYSMIINIIITILSICAMIIACDEFPNVIGIGPNNITPPTLAFWLFRFAKLQNIIAIKPRNISNKPIAKI